jgi:peptidoglycan hydrolase CwlO-like protein
MAFEVSGSFSLVFVGVCFLSLLGIICVLCGGARRQVADREKVIKNQSLQLGDLASEVAALQSTVKRHNAECEHKVHAVAALSRLCETFQVEIKLKEREIASQAGEIESLQSTVSTLIDSARDRDSEIQHLQAELRKQADEVSDKRMQVARLLRQGHFESPGHDHPCRPIDGSPGTINKIVLPRMRPKTPDTAKMARKPLETLV